MSKASIEHALSAAVKAHRAGCFGEAEILYRRILEEQPDNAQALSLLGTLAAQVGQATVAVELIRRSVAIDAENAGAYDSLGNALQANGQWDEAVEAYRQSLRIMPERADTYSNLGSALHARGDFAEAIEACRRSLELAPGRALTFNNLATALEANGQSEEAIAACRQAIQIDPTLASAYGNLGNALRSSGQLSESIEAHQTAVRLQPDDPDFHYNHGNALRDSGKLLEAIEAYRRCVELSPRHLGALQNLGNTLQQSGKINEAIATYEQSLEIDPNQPDVWSGLGNSLQASGRYPEAIAACRRAVELDSGNAAALNNLSVAFAESWRLDEAVEASLAASRLDPQDPAILNNLGNRYKDQGRLDLAIQSYRKALASCPQAADAHSNLIFTLSFHPAFDAEAIMKECEEWNHVHAEPVAGSLDLHRNDRDPDRRLRIGYVSPDFRDHVAGHNLLSLVRAHDRRQFEIYCYSNVLFPDHVTREFESRVHHWRNIADLSDEEAVNLIRRDQIDILVDLALHTARNRLLVFARKPAPVQACYLGYLGTTGLKAMDYRLSDRYIDPEGEGTCIYSEKTVRLPRAYWCYKPFGETPPVSPSPAVGLGKIIFGSLNNFCKISPRTLDLWMEILLQVQSSEILLHAPEGSCRARVLERANAHGVNRSRIEFVGRQSWADYIKTLQRIDIALDSFPYAGGITTCDALWMGVPVVTLAGRTAVGRGGLSILSALELDQFAANRPSEYLRIATELAADRAKLATLRRTLRERMESSPLKDSEGFASDMEAAYRQMWRTWSAGG